MIIIADVAVENDKRSNHITETCKTVNLSQHYDQFQIEQKSCQSLLVGSGNYKLTFLKTTSLHSASAGLASSTSSWLFFLVLFLLLDFVGASSKYSLMSSSGSVFFFLSLFSFFFGALVGDFDINFGKFLSRYSALV